MKFRVEHDALADAVAWVARVLPARPVVPLLSSLRLEAADGLALSCFDYELSATAGLKAEVAEPGAALVPGRLLADIVRSLPDLPVEFASDGDAVYLTCGSAEFALVSLPLSDYPELPPAPPLVGTLDGGELAEAIGQVLPAASRDDTLPILTAVCLDIRGDVMTLAATDRYRMAVRDLCWRPELGKLRAVALVPARTLADAARTLTAGVPVTLGFEAGPGSPAASGSGGTGDAADRAGNAGEDLRPAEGMISFESRGRRLTGRLMAGEFIRYESRFPAEFGCRAEVPALSFTEAVRRVSLVADRASPLHLTFEPGRVILAAQTEGRARAVETVTASFSGDQPSIAFNPHYLLDGLTAATAGAGRAGGPREGPPASVTGAAGGQGSPAVGGKGDGRPAGKDATAEDATGEGSPERAVSASARPAEPAWIRLEFTSPARPALITVVGSADGPAASGQGGRLAAAAGSAARPAFRYLVVPQRSPTRD